MLTQLKNEEDVSGNENDDTTGEDDDNEKESNEQDDDDIDMKIEDTNHADMEDLNS